MKSHAASSHNKSSGFRSDLAPASAAARLLEPPVKPGHGGVGLGVQDRMHHLRLTHHPEDGDRLVSADHQLEPAPPRRHQPLPGTGVTEATRPERRLVRLWAGVPGDGLSAVEATVSTASDTSAGVAPGEEGSPPIR